MLCQSKYKIYFDRNIVFSLLCCFLQFGIPLSVSQASSSWYSGGHRFDPLVWQHSFVEIGHEIIFTAIFSLPLIQVVQLSVAKRCALSTG